MAARPVVERSRQPVRWPARAVKRFSSPTCQTQMHRSFSKLLSLAIHSIDDVAVAFAYTASFEGVHIVDVSSPDNLETSAASGVQFPEWPLRWHRLRADNTGLRLWNVSDPTIPYQVGFVLWAGGGCCPRGRLRVCRRVHERHASSIRPVERSRSVSSRCLTLQLRLPLRVITRLMRPDGWLRSSTSPLRIPVEVGHLSRVLQRYCFRKLRLWRITRTASGWSSPISEPRRVIPSIPTVERSASPFRSFAHAREPGPCGSLTFQRPRPTGRGVLTWKAAQALQRRRHAFVASSERSRHHRRSRPTRWRLPYSTLLDLRPE
jgi:hypothetical protein